MTRTARVRVILAEDQPIYRDGVAQAIASRPDLDLIGECETGREAMELMATEHADVALLDLRLPDMTAVDILHAARDPQLATSILILSALTDPAMVYEAVAAGAAGYLTKGCSRDELCDAIVAVADGHRVLSNELQNLLIDEIPRHNGDDWHNLSGRENEVLRLVAEGHSARAIAASLHLSEATIKTHLKHLYEKLDVSERAAAVATAMRRGLLP